MRSVLRSTRSGRKALVDRVTNRTWLCRTKARMMSGRSSRRNGSPPEIVSWIRSGQPRASCSISVSESSCARRVRSGERLKHMAQSALQRSVTNRIRYCGTAGRSGADRNGPV